MERKTFKILFFIKKTRVSKNGEVPILLRVTVNGFRAETSVNLKVKPNLWHAPTGRILGTDAKSEELNNALDTIKLKVMKKIPNEKISDKNPKEQLIDVTIRGQTSSKVT